MGATAAEINQIIESAPSGAIVELSAGTYSLAETIEIGRPDIWFRGAQDGETKIVGVTAEGAYTIIRAGVYSERTIEGAALEDIAPDSTSFRFSGADSIQAGDVIRVWVENDEAFLGDPIYSNVDPLIAPFAPFREMIVEVDRVDGDVVHLKNAIPHAMAAEDIQVRSVAMFENVRISDFNLTYDLGTPDSYLLENVLPSLERAMAVEVYGLRGGELYDIHVENAASLAFEIRTSLDVVGARLSATGAHNKGGAGNGYGVEIYESNNTHLTDLTFFDMRHSVLFTSWHSENNNYIHVANT
ncbi:MAG: hypothetical protein RIM80_21380, partial [Alphaproteobacteria bacterium]